MAFQKCVSACHDTSMKLPLQTVCAASPQNRE